jgi:hypothetical protein
MMIEQSSRLDGYRHRRDRFFATHDRSPLSDEQRSRFTGLDYFPERDDLVFTLTLDENGPDIGDDVHLATTDGHVKHFTRAGRIRFDVDGQAMTLSVLRDAIQGGLFVPFKDAAANDETYEVGRYLEPKLKPDRTIEVDFNYAYNPFCAYGEGWSCPIPPPENELLITVPAGERAFRLPDAAAETD